MNEPDARPHATHMWTLEELRWLVTPGLGAGAPALVVSVGQLPRATTGEQWGSGSHMACEPRQDLHPEPELSVAVCFEACFQ